MLKFAKHNFHCFPPFSNKLYEKFLCAIDSLSFKALEDLMPSPNIDCPFWDLQSKVVAK